MRRLMGIYQNKNGEGTDGVSETNALFKFARRDSLLGIRDSAARENANAVVPAVSAETAPSPQEQLVEILQRRQILKDQQQQKQQQHVASSEDTTFSLEEQTVEMQHRRQLLQDHLQHQQQHVASSDDTNPSLREQVMEMLQRRLLLEDQQQQQHFPSILGVLGQGIGCDSSNKSNDAGSMMEFVLLQQHQRQQEHQNRMQLAVMAMNATRFPIRRDTLSHVHTNTTHSEAAASINHPSLPWNVTSMA